jgi:hypothetical protein
MADFTSLTLELNTGTQATPVWTNVLGASKETRFLDVNSGQRLLDQLLVLRP